MLHFPSSLLTSLFLFFDLLFFIYFHISLSVYMTLILRTISRLCGTKFYERKQLMVNGKDLE